MKNKLCTLLSFFLISTFFVIILTSCDSQSSTKTVYLGEVATNSKGVEFVVQSVRDTQQIGYYGTTENNFIIVTVKITNKGTESWSQNPNNCVLMLNDAEYEYSSNTFLLDDNMSSSNEINPGLTKTMSIAFETPTKSTENTYSIKLSGYSLWNDDSVTIVLTERPQ